MNRRSFIPGTDAGAEQFTANFGRIISTSPLVFGLTAVQATDYVARQTDFATKLTAAVDPVTRGKRTVFLKREAKKTIVGLTRKYGRQINNLVGVTDDQRQELGITIFDTNRTPVPTPATSPFIRIIKTDGRILTIELSQTKTKRGKPAKVAGAMIFTHTGATAPQSIDTWRFATATTRTTIEIPFGPSATGDTVWVTAFWNNSRDESGPAGTPVSINLPAGGVLPKEVGETIRLAA